MKTEQEIKDEIEKIDEYIIYLKNNNFGVGVDLYIERKKMLEWVLNYRKDKE